MSLVGPTSWLMPQRRESARTAALHIGLAVDVRHLTFFHIEYRNAREGPWRRGGRDSRNARLRRCNMALTAFRMTTVVFRTKRAGRSGAA